MDAYSPSALDSGLMVVSATRPFGNSIESALALALCQAAADGNHGTCQDALSLGGDPGFHVNGETPLEVAVDYGNVAILHLLLATCKDRNALLVAKHVAEGLGREACALAISKHLS